MIKEVNSNFCFFLLRVICVVHIICGLALIPVFKSLQILERPVVMSYVDNLAHETGKLNEYHEAQIFFLF